jgi:tetratricopeptide (TPR) repeat protein
MVAYERFDTARRAGASDPELLGHLKVAETASRQAQNLTPDDAVTSLAAQHNQLGMVYQAAGALDPALTHHKQAIRHGEVAGNRYDAARIRFKVALVLRQTGRLEEALLYAQAALRDLRPPGP